jgi:hypothetical protein
LNRNLQPGIHPDADQLSVFVEGAATAREKERMLAHLADCAECRKTVFLMQPREESQAAPATPAKEWVWRWLVPIGLPAAALACVLIAMLIYIRPRSAPPAVPPQIARATQPKLERPGAETAAVPATNSERVAPSGNPKNGVARNAAPPKLSQEKQHFAGGLNLSKSPSSQTAAKVASPQIVAAAPVPVPNADAARLAGTISAVKAPELPMNGRNVTNDQQLATSTAAQGAVAQNSLAVRKDVPELRVQHAGEQSETLAGVSGRITDRSGAAIAGATITLRDADGKTRQTTASADGTFHLAELPAGQYELTATASGFATSKQSIELKPSELALLKPMLDVGAASTAVEVAAQSNTVSIQTESANVGQVEAETRSMSRIIPVPSGQPVVTTVSHDKRLLSLDNSGNLFLSRNKGKNWKKINPQWVGKAVRIEWTTVASTGAAFQVTTDAGAVWTSKDGTHWHQQ